MSDLNQVIQKFMTQEDTNRNLKQLTKDGQLRIEALKDEIRACKDKLESLQFAAPPASSRAHGGRARMCFNRPSTTTAPNFDSRL